MSDVFEAQILAPLQSHDGLNLFRRSWPHPQPRASVLLVHGLGEHSGRYQALAHWFWQQGLSVQAYDQRGHGRSQGRRGGLPRADDLLRDLQQVWAAFTPAQPGPVFLLGHSMGGLVCARAVLDRRLQPDAVVLSAPALRSWSGRGLQRLASCLARCLPWLSLAQGLPTQALSHDPQVAADFLADPYCHDRITPALADFIFKAGPACVAEAAAWPVPCRLLIAGQDRLVDPAGSQDFAAAAPAVQASLYAGAYHELFHEVPAIRATVLSDLAAWLQPRLG